MGNVSIKIIYRLRDDSFETETNAKDPVNLVGEFLRTQIDGGEDNSLANGFLIYEICLTLDTSGDIWSCQHNCGNLGLRDGILGHYIRKMNMEKPNERD